MPRRMHAVIIMLDRFNNETPVFQRTVVFNGNNIALLRTKDCLSPLQSWHKWAYNDRTKKTCQGKTAIYKMSSNN